MQSWLVFKKNLVFNIKAFIYCLEKNILNVSPIRILEIIWLSKVICFTRWQQKIHKYKYTYNFDLSHKKTLQRNDLSNSLITSSWLVVFCSCLTVLQSKWDYSPPPPPFPQFKGKITSSRSSRGDGLIFFIKSGCECVVKQENIVKTGRSLILSSSWILLLIDIASLCSV